MSKPKLFIASSSESISIVEAITIKLSTTCDISQWDNAFNPSSFTFPTLARKANEVSYAIFVFHPDDEIIIRDNVYSIVRDNVLFELGLFVGKLGIERCFIICPDSIGERNLRIPTDLSGITFCTYDSTRIASEPLDAVTTACGRIRIVINGYEQESSQIVSSPINIPNEHFRNLESQVWSMNHELKRVEEDKIKLEGTLLEYFNSVVRPATEREIMEWVEGAKQNYDDPSVLSHNVFYTNKDVIIPTLYGASSINLIVAPGARVFGIQNKGHNKVYFMDGFRKAD